MSKLLRGTLSVGKKPEIHIGNRRKLQAKRARNFWTCARPVTQIVPNKRAYNRKREKDIRCKYKEGEQE